MRTTLVNILSSKSGFCYLVVSPSTDIFTYIISIDQESGVPLYSGIPGTDIFNNHSSALKFLLARGANVVVQGQGLIGISRHDNASIIAVIDKVDVTGCLPGGYLIKTIRNVVFWNVNSNSFDKSLMEEFQINDYHYFCEGHDLTGLFSLTKQDVVDYEFIWNVSWRQIFLLMGIQQCCIYLIQGIGVTKDFDELGFKLTFIARRSVLNPGTRYAARGLNKHNQPANEVECQLIFEKGLRFWTKSYRRGSIPIRWKTVLASKISAPKHKVQGGNFSKGTAEYFKELQKRFELESIICVSLLEFSPEEHSAESEIAESFQNSFELLEQAGLHGISLINFNLNEKIHKGLEVDEILSDFLKLCGDKIDSSGFTSGSLPYTIDCKQNGLMRFNCADSLDRTNIATFFFAIKTVATWCEKQDVGLIGQIQNPTKPHLYIHPDILNFLVNSFLESGNIISQLYTNTPAIKMNIFKYFQPSIVSYSDSSISMKRRLENVVNDPQRMKVITLWTKQSDFSLIYYNIDPTHIFVLPPDNGYQCLFSDEPKMFTFPSSLSEFMICFPFPCRVNCISMYLVPLSSEDTFRKCTIMAGKTLDSINYLYNFSVPEVENETWLKYNLLEGEKQALNHCFNDYIRFLKFKFETKNSMFKVGSIKIEVLSYLSNKKLTLYSYNRKSDLSSDFENLFGRFINDKRTMKNILEHELLRIDIGIQNEEWEKYCVKNNINPWSIDSYSQLLIKSSSKCLFCQHSISDGCEFYNYKRSFQYPGLILRCNEKGDFIVCKKCMDFGDHISNITSTFEKENKPIISFPSNYALIKPLQQNFNKKNAIGTYTTFVPLNIDSNVLYPSFNNVTINEGETKSFEYFSVLVSSVRQIKVQSSSPNFILIFNDKEKELSLFLPPNVYIYNFSDEKETQFQVVKIKAKEKMIVSQIDTYYSYSDRTTRKAIDKTGKYKHPLYSYIKVQGNYNSQTRTETFTFKKKQVITKIEVTVIKEKKMTTPFSMIVSLINGKDVVCYRHIVLPFQIKDGTKFYYEINDGKLNATSMNIYYLDRKHTIKPHVIKAIKE